MELDASFRVRESAAMSLTLGMTAQTAQKLGAIDKILTDLSIAVTAPGAEDEDAMKSKLRAPALEEILADWQIRTPGVVALIVVDSDGRLAATSRSRSVEGIDLSGNDFFLGLRARADGAPYVSAPSRDPATGLWSSFIARGLKDARGRFAGVVAAEISLGDLEEFYRVAMPPRRGVTVMRDDGLVMVQYPHHFDRTGQKASGLASHPLGSTGATTYHGPDLFDGAPVVAAVARMATLPIVVETFGPEAEALEDWGRERRWLVIGGVVASAAVMALLLIFARQLRRIEASERSLATAHSQLETALSNIPQGVCFFDRDRKLVVSNRRYWEIYGMQPGSFPPGATLSEIVDRRSQCIGISTYSSAVYSSWFEEIADAGMAHITRPGAAHQALLELSDGRTVATRSQPMPEGGWVATHEDITERRKADEKIAFLARHDALTSLPNRSLLMERIEFALKDAARGRDFAILFLDLDRFKAVNDTLGHNVGDELLRSVAGRLIETVRHGCTVARLGGDEFVILQVGVETPEGCAALAKRIIKVIGAPYILGEHEVVIGVSVGIDTCGPNSSSGDVLLKHADLALYMAKADGRGTFRFFEPEMDLAVQNRRQRELDLRRAVEEKQFLLHYQPVIDVASGKVCAFEALLRWNHPTRGLVAPGDFIAASEETGLIVPIGEWVIGEACRQAALWPERIGIAVNVSPAQFRAAGLVQVIQEALSANGIAPHRLEIEITETVLLLNSERNLSILRQLRDLGINIAMDDFGVGYSSLSYLQKFPFNKIKIDRSFVTELTIRPEAVFFVRAIVDLCRNLGIKTTAEGVETLEQLSLLLEEDCTQIQGYLFARPCAAEQAAEFIGRNSLIAVRPKRAPPSRLAENQMGLAS